MLGGGLGREEGEELWLKCKIDRQVDKFKMK